MTERATRPPRRPAHAVRTDAGRVRSQNEDRALAAPPLFAVADGMGGHEFGEIAAELAITVLARDVRAGARPAALARAMRSAHADVRRAATEPGHAGMGTTCTALLVARGRVDIAHVGDSRAYLLRAGALSRLTTDHSLVGELVAQGILTQAQAEQDDRRHVLTRAVGISDGLDVEVRSHDLAPGDRLMLCSDGLSGQVDDGSIGAVLQSEPDPATAAETLVNLANEAGGVDNVTVIVVDVGEAGDVIAGGWPDRAATSPRTAGIAHRRIAAAAVILAAATLLGAAVVAGLLGPGGPGPSIATPSTGSASPTDPGPQTPAIPRSPFASGVGPPPPSDGGSLAPTNPGASPVDGVSGSPDLR